MKTALISVYDKTDILEFAQFLIQKNYRIISTGGTFKYLAENNVSVTEINEITHFPEILEGRVKTLSPYIHAGILAKRNKPEHLQTLENHNIKTIDMVVVNLYPFFEMATKNLPEQELIEFIDIGGPTMLRAAAKSFQDVTVVCNTIDYDWVTKEINEQNDTTFETRRTLAAKVFNLTSAYDGAIAQMLLNETDEFPAYAPASFVKKFDLRYGENPHQKAAFYADTNTKGAFNNFNILNGKELSFNNLRDMDTAWKIVSEFAEIACCAIKHSTPCGVALANNELEAWQKTYTADPISVFGGIVAFNTQVTAKTAQALNEIFLEVVLAPNFSDEALEILKNKKNLRIIEMLSKPTDTLEMIKIDGGLLMQTADNQFSKEFKTVTETQATNGQLMDLVFAQKIVKHVKSNAIVIASDLQTLGIGTGQTNRIWATKQAIQSAKEKKQTDLVMASDAFFPFRDVVDFAATEGITAIVQPGGSIKDEESIQACNEHKIPMIFTGMRHFKH